MINVIVGKPGTGKTYSLVRLALKCARKKINVYSNFKIDFKGIPNEFNKNPKSFENWKDLNKYIHYWKDVKSFVNIKKGVIIIDEVQIYFNSRNWKELPLRVQYKFQQHRKHGLDIWGATQNVKRIDSIVRELVNTVYQVRRVGKLFIMKSYDIEDIDKASRKSYSTTLFFLNSKIADSYDTFAEIEI